MDGCRLASDNEYVEAGSGLASQHTSVSIFWIYGRCGNECNPALHNLMEFV